MNIFFKIWVSLFLVTSLLVVTTTDRTWSKYVLWLFILVAVSAPSFSYGGCLCDYERLGKTSTAQKHMARQDGILAVGAKTPLQILEGAGAVFAYEE